MRGLFGFICWYDPLDIFLSFLPFFFFFHFIFFSFLFIREKNGTVRNDKEESQI